MAKHFILFLCFVAIITSCNANIDNIFGTPALEWTRLKDGHKEQSVEKTVYEEFFGQGNSLRLNQSMCIWHNNVFCFNHGNECKVLSLGSKEWQLSDPLPEQSHNNNAQFLNSFYNYQDKYPLLLVSRGDYPPNQNCAYIMRVTEENNRFSFLITKKIDNTIQEAQYNGSWVIDQEHGRLFLYTMTADDYRVRDNNYFCIFSFILPNILDSKDITLTYDDVLEKWEYEYLVLQGGTYYNGYLLFNVQSLNSIDGHGLLSAKNVLAINASNGKIEAVLPLFENNETEGICVYDNKLYISFKNGQKNQEETNKVFSLIEYTLPSFITKK